GRAADEGERLFLVLRRGQRGAGGQGAERLPLQPTPLGLRRRPDRRGDCPDGDRYPERRGTDLPECSGQALHAHPGHGGVRDLPLIPFAICCRAGIAVTARPMTITAARAFSLPIRWAKRAPP